MRMYKYYILMVVGACMVSCANEGIAYKKAEQSFAIGEYYNAAALYKL